MHHIDRTQRELELAMHEMQPEHFEFGEYESGGETETLHAGLHEAGLHELHESEAGLHEAGLHEFHEMGHHEAGLHETGMHALHESEAHESGEAQELELAAELLEVTNEAELEQFLGRLIRRVARSAGQFVRSPLGRALGGILKPILKAAVPLAGRALGTFVGGPVGGMVGGQLASAAGRMFGLELEGLSGEDREFEVARRLVRYSNAVVRNALSAAPSANPITVAQAAAAAAARALAPGLAAAGAYPYPVPAGHATRPERRRGFWYRRGDRIVLVGL